MVRRTKAERSNTESLSYDYFDQQQALAWPEWLKKNKTPLFAIFLKWNFQTQAVMKNLPQFSGLIMQDLPHLTQFAHDRHYNRYIALYNCYPKLEDVKSKTILSWIKPATFRSTSKRFGAPLGKQLLWPCFYMPWCSLPSTACALTCTSKDFEPSLRIAFKKKI